MAWWPRRFHKPSFPVRLWRALYRVVELVTRPALNREILGSYPSSVICTIRIAVITTVFQIVNARSIRAWCFDHTAAGEKVRTQCGQEAGFPAQPDASKLFRVRLMVGRRALAPVTGVRILTPELCQ